MRVPLKIPPGLNGDDTTYAAAGRWADCNNVRTANRGGGGGGSGTVGVIGGAGGSGIVVVRYFGPARWSGGTITASGGFTIHTFNSSGSMVPA